MFVPRLHLFCIFDVETYLHINVETVCSEQALESPFSDSRVSNTTNRLCHREQILHACCFCQ